LSNKNNPIGIILRFYLIAANKTTRKNFSFPWHFFTSLLFVPIIYTLNFNMSTAKKLIVILGPTASGKTEMALKLAKKFNGEIVNADSRQIYKEMEIGTGSPVICDDKKCHSEFSSESIIDFKKNSSMQNNQKISEIKLGQNLIQQKILKQVQNDNGQVQNDNGQVQNDNGQVQNDNTITINNIPHHLFHIINPNQKFSLARYKKLAIKTIKDIQKQNKLPILVGGTGLYISAIVDNLKIPKAPPNDKIRDKLEKHTEKYLFNKLKKIDSQSAKIIGPDNKRKLIRALEVYEITGRPFSVQQIKGKSLFDILQLGVKIDRQKLYKKIDQRTDKMIKIGLIEETKKLSKKYSFDLPAMSGIGYKEIGLYLENKISLNDAVQKMKFRTHQYARRQMTWFKRDERIKWVSNYKEAKNLVKNFLFR
jgi:tRNA dimethylallyltransferase